MRESPARANPSVYVVVLTYNAPAIELAACVSAIQQQTVTPRRILVVDNHSSRTPSVEAADERHGSVVQVLTLDRNTGVGGGFAAGMEQFLQSGCDYLWAMDDDIRPDPDCLEQLLGLLRAHGDRGVAMPVAIDIATGDGDDNGWGWWAVLIPRIAVETCGFPRRDFFYGLEEQEYFIDRLPGAGYPAVRSTGAVVRMLQRAPTSIAAWKYYYLVRNMTYRYLYDRSHIRRATRLKSLAHGLVKWTRTAMSDPSERLAKVAYLLRGVMDGVGRRLGERVTPDRADRSWGTLEGPAG